MNDSVLIEIDHDVGIITLNQPARHNALDSGMTTALNATLIAMSSNPLVRVVVISAIGESFCAGTQLHDVQPATQFSPQQNLDDARNLADLLATLDGLPKPTIARVQGNAQGLGVGLIACCDIAVATHACRFANQGVHHGMVPSILTPYLVSAIGARQARRYLLTGESIAAPEAYRLGLLHETVPTIEDLDARVGELIDHLLLGAPAAQADCKTLLRRLEHLQPDESVQEETAQVLARSRNSDEGREGLQAYLQGRVPRWAQ